MHAQKRATQKANSLVAYLDNRADRPVKLHLGCGGEKWLDFVNVDFYPHNPNVLDSSRSGCVAEVFADMRDLGLPDNTVSEIFTSHTFEHFTRWEGISMLKDWHRMLRPGGSMVIETPDFVRCVLWLFHPSKRKRELARSQFYGNQWNCIDFETHRYVWSAWEIKKVLRDIGFVQISVTHATWTHHPGRDMRICAKKAPMKG